MRRQHVVLCYSSYLISRAWIFVLTQLHMHRFLLSLSLSLVREYLLYYIAADYPFPPSLCSIYLFIRFHTFLYLLAFERTLVTFLTECTLLLLLVLITLDSNDGVPAHLVVASLRFGIWKLSL